MSVARLANRKNSVAPSNPFSAPNPPPSTRSNGPSMAWRRVRPPIERASNFTSKKLGMNSRAKAMTAAAAESHGGAAEQEKEHEDVERGHPARLAKLDDLCETGQKSTVR